jgi:oligopeptide transport system substrate-binding protein
MSGTGARIARPGIALALFSALAVLLILITDGARRERADLVINNGGEVRTLDPTTLSGVAEGRLIRALFEGLTVMHPATLEPLPGVASSWETSEDGRTWRFRIRPDAFWIEPGTDPARFGERGDPITAHDFVRSWERLLHPATAAEYAYQLWCVRGAREYSMLPDDRLFGGASTGLWIQRREPGRVRVGVQGYRLAEIENGELGFAVIAEEGALLEKRQAVIEIDGTPLPSVLSGRVLAVNPDLPATLAELAEDPYERGWILELEVAEGVIDRAIEAHELLPAEIARREIFWPSVGIHAPDDHTLVVELDRPTPYFLDLTGYFPLYPVHLAGLEAAKERWPDEWASRWVAPEQIVTNGPFRIVERRLNDRIRLVKNPIYWDAENVAMHSIDYLAVEHLITMLNLYLTEEVDWIDRVPPSLVPRLLLREDFDPSPHLGTYFYRLNVARPPLDDVRVRRALALAIDRRAICEKVAKAGQIPSWGFLPPGFAPYRRSELEHADPGEGFAHGDEAFAIDCTRARELLAEAGYGEGGRSLPAVEIHYNTSELHRDIAEVVSDGWRRWLGIETRLRNQEWKVYLDAQRSLDYQISRSSWIGDFVDPVNFLNVFRTGGANNRTGWSNSRFDALLAEATDEVDGERRLLLLSEAEGILMSELPILPLYTYVTGNVVNPRLGGFEANVLDVHFPKFFHWLDDDALAAKRAATTPAITPAKQRVPAPGPAEGRYSPAETRRRETARGGSPR